MKVAQKWACPVCGETYEAPISVTAAYCGRIHPSGGRGRSGQHLMDLVEGKPATTKPNRKKKGPPNDSRKV